MYCVLRSSTKDTFWERLPYGLWDGREHVPPNKFVDMFMKNTDGDSKNRILATFVNADSPIRCVVATIAFGMGVQVDDVRTVVHWGAPRNILNYWQV